MNSQRDLIINIYLFIYFFYIEISFIDLFIYLNNMCSYLFISLSSHENEFIYLFIFYQCIFIMFIFIHLFFIYICVLIYLFFLSLTEARPKSTFSEKGCKLPCECDESRGYIGEDPCLCRKRARSFLLQTLHRKWWKHSFAKPTVWSASNHTQMCSIVINLKLYTCTYLCIELLDVFVFILKNKMAFFLL